MNDGYFLVDYQSLKLNDTFLSGWENFEDHLVNNSEYCLQCLGLAMHQYVVEFHEKTATEDKGNIEDLRLKIIYPRIVNFEPVMSLKDIRVNYYGKVKF